MLVNITVILMLSNMIVTFVYCLINFYKILFKKLPPKTQFKLILKSFIALVISEILMDMTYNYFKTYTEL